MAYKCVAHLGGNEGEGSHSWEFDLPTVEECLDQLFYNMNHEETTPLNARSMSVGDCASVSNMSKHVSLTRHFICLSVGWCEVTEHVLHKWMRHDWNRRMLHPLVGVTDPLLALLHVQKMDAGFMRMGEKV
jgi:hypothetical protein